MEAASKTCRNCKEEKEASLFSPSFSYKDGLHCYCRACMTKRSADWQKRNPERAKQLKKESRARNPDGVRAAQRKWNMANVEKCRAYQREYARQRRASWKKANPERVRATERKLSLWKRGLTPEQFDQILEEQGGGCAICGKQNSNGRILGVDHDHSCHPAGGRSCSKCARGLLCTPCNTALHRMENDVRWHLKALAYLQRFSKRE
jgi:hypothetical protein